MTQTQNPELVDVSLLTDIPSVSAHLSPLETAEEECRLAINTFMQEELAQRNISHAAAIHELKQRRTVIEFVRTFLRSRLSRLHDEASL